MRRLLFVLLFALLLPSVVATAGDQIGSTVFWQTLDTRFTSGSIFIDSAANVNFTNNGTASATGQVNESRDFELTELDSLIGGSGKNGQQALSIMFWFKPEQTITTALARQVVMQVNTTSTSQWEVITSNHYNCVNETIAIGDGSKGTCYAGGDFTAGTWYHMVWNWNSTATQYNFFLDGVKQVTTNSSAGNSPIVTVFSPLMGRRGLGQYLDGELDEVGIFNVSFSGEEILQVYNNNTNDESWPFGGFIGPPVNNTLIIQAINNITGIAISGFCAELNSSLTLCNTTGTTVKFLSNISKLYNVTINNVSDNTFFNYTILDVNFSIGALKNIFGHHWQGIIRLNATRLFLNTSINVFNGTNGVGVNQTTSGVVLLRALSGSNNVRVDVGGNFSVNGTCVVGTLFSTVNCGVGGVYDTELTLGARSSGSALSPFGYVVVNDTLGGTLFDATSLTEAVVLSLLQGFKYDVAVSKSGFVTNTTNVTLVSTSGLLNVTLDGITINITFLDELNRTLIGANITVGIITSNNTQTVQTTTTSSLLLEGLFPPGVYTIRYSADGFSTREFIFTLLPEDINLTLYLISEEVFTPGTVEIRNFDGTIVPGAIIRMIRYYGDPTIPNTVQMATTNSVGQAVLVAESVTGFYQWEVAVDGELRFEQTTPELLAVEADGLWHKIFILNRTALDTANRFTGIDIGFSPGAGFLANNTEFVFSVDVSSSFWTITSCSFFLVNGSGGNIVAGPNTSFCGAGGGRGNLTFTTPPNTTNLVAMVNVTTSEFTNQYFMVYGVSLFSNETFTLRDLVDDIERFDRAGWNDFNKFIISIIIIIGVVGGTSALSASRRQSSASFINNTEEVLLLIFAMSLFFSYIGWMTVTIDTIPFEPVKQYLAVIIIGMVTVIEIYRKHGA